MVYGKQICWQIMPMQFTGGTNVLSTDTEAICRALLYPGITYRGESEQQKLTSPYHLAGCYGRISIITCWPAARNGN